MGEKGVFMGTIGLWQGQGRRQFCPVKQHHQLPQMKHLVRTLAGAALCMSLLLLPGAAFAQRMGKHNKAAQNEALGRAMVQDAFNAKSAEAMAAAVKRVVSHDYIQHNPYLL